MLSATSRSLLRPAYSEKLVFSYVVKRVKIKIIPKFRASRRLCFEDTKRIMSPESSGTFEKRTLGACFSNVPKLFGRICGDIILFVSSKQRCLEARNFAVIFIFIRFTTYEKTSFTEQAGRSFTIDFSGPKSYRDFRETGPRSFQALAAILDRLTLGVDLLLVLIRCQTR